MPYFQDNKVIASIAVLDGEIPLIISSSKKIENLNADLLDGQHAEYFLNLENFKGILPAVSFNATTHGQLPGETLHALVTTSVAGFMSAEDKIKLNSLAPNENINTISYSSFTDGTNLAQAGIGSTSIKFRTSNVDYFSIVVTSNDYTHGDNVLFSLNTQKIIEDVLNSIDITYVTINTNTTLQKNYYYFVDTRLSPVSLTLFANPSSGDTITIVDAYNTFDLNAATILSNKFHTINDSLKLSFNKSYTLIYVNSTFGWKVI